MRDGGTVPSVPYSDDTFYVSADIERIIGKKENTRRNISRRADISISTREAYPNKFTLVLLINH